VGFVPARIFDADFSNQYSGIDRNGDGLKDAPSCNMVKFRLKLNTEDPLLHLPSNAISSGRRDHRDEEVFLINPHYIVPDPVRRTPNRGEPQNIGNIYEEQLCYDREADNGASPENPRVNEPRGDPGHSY
jgi:hypothetical protein